MVGREKIVDVAVAILQEDQASPRRSIQNVTHSVLIVSEDLDLYRSGPRRGYGAILRGVARGVGILLGLAVSVYGAALYALRCFDTCPTDPAVDATGQLLTWSIILLGFGLVTAAASVGTRWSRIGLGIISVLGSAVALCGVASVVIAPSIKAAGDYSSTTTLSYVAAVTGGVAAGAAHLLRRRTRSG